MSTWSGWVGDFLAAGRIINTPPNRNFLTAWANHANSPNCRRNPIDLHSKVGASTNCAHPAGFTWWTQSYASHADSARAFANQVNSLQFGAILDTLGTGNPFQDPGHKQVADALRTWGSTNFADWYLAQFTSGGGGGGGGGGGNTSIHKGWDDLRKSVNHKLPAALHDSQKGSAAALRQLQRARKVKL